MGYEERNFYYLSDPKLRDEFNYVKGMVKLADIYLLHSHSDQRNEACNILLKCFDLLLVL